MGQAARSSSGSHGYTRTNVVLNDELVEKAMKLYRTRSKRDVIELALRHLIGEPLSREDKLSLQGIGWEGDLEEMRANRIEL